MCIRDSTDALALLEHAVDHAHQHHHAQIDVVPAVDQQRLERRLAVALRWRQPGDDRFQYFGHILAGLGRDHDRIGSVEADHVLDLLLDRFRLGRRQIDLIEHRHDFVAGVDGVIDIGERLRLDALAGVEAQTLANVYHAIDAGHEIVPVLNKVDLPAAEPEAVKKQIEDVIGLDASNAIMISAKTGQNVPEVLEAIVTRLPPPKGDREAPLKALLVDSWYDAYLGVVVLVRIVDGVLKKGQRIRMMGTS